MYTERSPLQILLSITRPSGCLANDKKVQTAFGSNIADILNTAEGLVITCDVLDKYCLDARVCPVVSGCLLPPPPLH